MRKISQILTAAVFSVAFVGAGFLGSSAGAAPCNGTITVSGNNSNANVNCTDIKTVVITCQNDVNVVTVNYQDGTSGPATVTGNATGGNASTGSVFNNNDSTVNASAACAVTPAGSTEPTPTSSASPTPSTTPTKPVALPNTAGASAEVIVVSSLLAAAAVVIASRLAVAAYRRIGSK